MSVILLSSAWPLTKIAIGLGSTPLWFAEGRAVLSGVSRADSAVRGRLRVPRRADLPALFAVGVCQLGRYFAFAHEAVAWVPAGRTAILANTTTIWVVPLSLIFLREHDPAAPLARRRLRPRRRGGPDEPMGDRLVIARRPDRPCLPARRVAVVVGGDHRHPRRDAALHRCSSCCPGASCQRGDAGAAGGVGRAAWQLRRAAASWAALALYRPDRRAVRHLVRDPGDRDVAGRGVLGWLPDDAGDQPDPRQL